MVKVAIYPPNSLVLADLIERKGHTPLALQKQIVHYWASYRCSRSSDYC